MVEIKIDKQRRLNLQRLHTATHILNNCSKKILGDHVWQNGSNLIEEYGILDITHYKSVSFKQLKEIENLANQIVFENKKVEIVEMSRNKAEKEFGYTIYQGGAIPMKDLRIIKVEDSDIEACGGIHVKNTGEIGIINIENISKIQDGVVRLKYRVNHFATKFVNQKENILQELKEFYKVSQEDLLKSSVKFFEGFSNSQKEVSMLKGKIKTLILSDINNSNKKEYEIDFDLDMNELVSIYESLKTKIIIKTNKFLVSENEEKGDFKKIINKKDYKIHIL